jgi:hypothetical protein
MVSRPETKTEIFFNLCLFWKVIYETKTIIFGISRFFNLSLFWEVIYETQTEKLEFFFLKSMFVLEGHF